VLLSESKRLQDIHFLRSRIVIVDQNTVLFNTTIRDNIAYGLEGITDEQVVSAVAQQEC
jgi:ABC-type multidrug transport system fused ATPase/permease subunit